MNLGESLAPRHGRGRQFESDWFYQNKDKSMIYAEITPAAGARASASNSLLDLTYGKPAVKEEKETVDLPPRVIELNW